MHLNGRKDSGSWLDLNLHKFTKLKSQCTHGCKNLTLIVKGFHGFTHTWKIACIGKGKVIHHCNIHLLLYFQTTHNLYRYVQINLCRIILPQNMLFFVHEFADDLICSRMHMQASLIGELNLSRGLDQNANVDMNLKIY